MQFYGLNKAHKRMEATHEVGPERPRRHEYRGVSQRLSNGMIACALGRDGRTTIFAQASGRYLLLHVKPMKLFDQRARQRAALTHY